MFGGSCGGPRLEMRCRLFRSPPKKSLFIADSQTRDLEFPNINISTLPGAKVNDVQRIIPPKGKYELIAIFVGGNDLYNYCLPSESSVEKVAERICALADQLLLVTESVFVLHVPPRFPTRRQIRAYGLTEEQLQRHTQVNKILGERSLVQVGLSRHLPARLLWKSRVGMGPLSLEFNCTQWNQDSPQKPCSLQKMIF